VTTNGPDVKTDGQFPRDSAAIGGAAVGGVAHGLGRLRVLIAVSGIVAGLAAFGIGEATSDLVPPDTVKFDFFGAARAQVTRDTQRVVTRTAALAFGVLGVCVAGGLGIAGGLARRSASACVPSGLFGAVLGGILGAGGALALLPFSMEMRSEHPNNDLVFGILLHGIIWGPLGATAGLAYVLGLGQPRLIGRAMVAGFAGAVVGSVAFDLIGGFAFPLAKTDSAISLTWESRLFARLMVSSSTAAVVALLVPALRPASGASPEPSIPTTIPAA
jgi:hypothetical protein